MKTNFVFPEDGRFISSKFDMDPYIHGEDPLDQKNADGRTDGFSVDNGFYKIRKQIDCILAELQKLKPYKNSPLCAWYIESSLLSVLHRI